MPLKIIVLSRQSERENQLLADFIRAKACPSQVRCVRTIVEALEMSSGVVIVGERGVAEIVRLMQAIKPSSKSLNASSFVHDMQNQDPIAFEQAIFEEGLKILASHELLIIEDAGALCEGFSMQYTCVDIMYWSITALVKLCGKDRKIILTRTREQRVSDSSRLVNVEVPNFDVEDFRYFLTEVAGAQLDESQVTAIFRFAPHLTEESLLRLGSWINGHDPISAPTIPQMLAYISDESFRSNTVLSEVANVRLEDLRGVDDVVRALERDVVLAFDDNEFVREVGLTPKRGVLLHGPPGSGKTTVGRALAHRLKGKFFLLDGSANGDVDPGLFFKTITNIFQEAIANAPSLLFLDDADVLFAEGGNKGLLRYLLTMLDGLEGKEAEGVSLFLTAMNVNDLPRPILRSGRVELWLEMPLPASSTRIEIMQSVLAQRVSEPVEGVDWQRIADETTGFVGADLRNVVIDARNLLGFDIVKKLPRRSLSEYLSLAADAIATQKNTYQRAMMTLGSAQ